MKQMNVTLVCEKINLIEQMINSCILLLYFWALYCGIKLHILSQNACLSFYQHWYFDSGIQS